MGLRVQLTSNDVQAASDFCERFRKLKPKPIEAKSTRVETDWQLAGKLGEIAVGKTLGLPVNLEVFEHADQHDFILPDGRTLAVRSVQVMKRMDYPFKLTMKYGDSTSDLLCLVLISPNQDHAVIEGYISIDDFFQRAKIAQTWDDRGRAVKPLTLTKSVLQPFDDLYVREEPPIEGL